MTKSNAAVAQRALRHAERLGALFGGETLGAVDSVGRHAGEQHVAARCVEVPDEGVELVDRADRLGGVAVLLQPAPGVERDGARLPQRPCGAFDVGG